MPSLPENSKQANKPKTQTTANTKDAINHLVLSVITKIFPITSHRDHFIHCSVWLPISYLSNGKVNTLSTGKRDPWFVAFANN